MMTARVAQPCRAMACGSRGCRPGRRRHGGGLPGDRVGGAHARGRSQALLNPPDYLSDIPDGSPQDEIDGRLASGLSEEADNPYEKALRSTRVRGEFDGQRVRIPGFVVPLDFDAERNITAFFLVPYFGACLHTPPPPPNQIIYAEFSSGVRMDDIYYPYWLEGTLNVALEETELGTSAYTMAVDNVTPYEE